MSSFRVVRYRYFGKCTSLKNLLSLVSFQIVVNLTGVGWRWGWLVGDPLLVEYATLKVYISKIACYFV